MKRLVSYSSSSVSSSNESRKKITRVQCPTIGEVSSSLVGLAEDDFLAESIESKEAKLKEMGCSSEQVAHAINVCGGHSSITGLLDFIQACQHDSWNENEGHESCTQEVPSSDLKDSYGKDQASCLKHKEMVLEGGFIDEPIGSPSLQLQEMGCSSELAAHAINVCGKGTPIPELFDYIQACQYALEGQELKENTELQLGEMGFTQQQIKTAFDACGTESNIVVLADFIQAHYCNEGVENSNSNIDKVDSSEDENDGDPSCIMELKSMGFPVRAIENAMTACESCDREMLLAVLLEDKSIDPSAQTNMELKTKGKKQSVTVEHCSNRSLSGATSQDKAGCSKKPFPRTKWTTDRREHNYHSSSDETDYLSGSGFGIPQEGMSRNIPSPESKSMGFGTPGNLIGRSKPLPDWLQGPPYFYFTPTNVPKDDWDTIHRHFDILPEFVDLKYFSACEGLQRFIHNLPVSDRKPIQPAPPMSIFEALPRTRQYWPWWDKRQKLNFITSKRGGEKVCGAIADTFVNYEGMDIPEDIQDQILKECHEWNLIWVAPGRAAPLEPNEAEGLLGFDEDHTRGCTNMTERYEVLGNTIQVNIAAYHLSVLKTLYPDGIRVLSIYPGIGGAEVALHKLGIFLKTVVFVGVTRKTLNIITSWWKKSGQRGEMKVKEDVKELTNDVIARLVDEVGCIDLIIGGSPMNSCGSTSHASRKSGLNVTHATWFFEFPRILRNLKAYL